MTTTARFHATLLQARRTATGFEVPAEVLARLDGGRRPKVVVTIGGYVYRSSIGSMGGRSMLPVSAEHRAGAGIAAGDEVDVAVALDTEPRVLAVPPDLAAALAGAPEARRAFDELSYSAQRAHVDPIQAARRAETRARRIARSVAALAAVTSTV